MKCDTPFEKYSDLCDLFNEIFKTGNWGVTRATARVINNGETNILQREIIRLFFRLW